MRSDVDFQNHAVTMWHGETAIRTELALNRVLAILNEVI